MKSLNLVLCVVALLGSAASTFFYIQIGDTKTKLEEQVVLANGRTADEKAKLADANSQIDGLQKRMAALDSDLGDTKSKLTSSDNRNVELARNVDQLNNQITAKDEAAKALNNEIATIKADLATAKAEITPPEEIENYKKSIADLQARVTEFESKAVKVVAKDGSTKLVQPATELKGKVSSIGTQNAFVVIDVGQDQGVQINQQFSITRGVATLATAKVSSVSGNYSIGQIIPDSLKGDVAKGDNATLVAQ